MSNHLHLIVRAKPENISLCMIKALSPYARHFNRRHNRCGHLFQERFASSPIDSDEYLMTAVRYVHLNPVGKNTESAERTLWSSYREYIDFPGLAATEFVLDVFGGLESFVKFHQLPNNDQLTRAYEFEYPNGAEYLRDDHAIREAKALLGVDDLAAIGQLDKETRNNMLAILKARFGIQRTVRLTGIGRNIIQRACPKSNESFKTG